MNSNAPDLIWRKQKAKLKLIFTQLHDEDFQFDYGKKEVMLTELEKKIGKTREELNQLLATL